VSDDPLNDSTLLQLVAGTRTRIDAAGHVLVDTPSGTVIDAGPNGFEILALFSRARPLGEALGALRDRPYVMPAATVVMGLIETGGLAAVDGSPPTQGWADPVDHARMLNDFRRTSAYIAAIDSTVRDGDVVVDIGTGSGILAVAAARAGARRVYAIEASDIAEVAQRVFEVNGVADRVTLIEGWSTDVEIPEPADVLVSEIIGTEPLEEELLETTVDARRRLLRPGARLIPRGLRLFARPLHIPSPGRWGYGIDRDAIDDWRRRYGVDLSPLLAAVRPEPVHLPTSGNEVSAWTRMGADSELLNLDFGAIEASEVHASAELAITEKGSADAVLVTFRADLADGIEFVQEPRADEFSSWASSVWNLPEPIEVEPGSALRVEYRRHVPGVADGLSCYRP
jgi:hypothetical protein